MSAAVGIAAAAVVWFAFVAGILAVARTERRRAALEAARRLREIRRIDMREWYRDEGER